MSSVSLPVGILVGCLGDIVWRRLGGDILCRSRRPKFVHCARYSEQGSFAILICPTLIASIITCKNPEDPHPDDDWNP